MRDFKLSEESAKDQLQVFYDHYDIDLDSLPEDGKANLKLATDRLVRAIRTGHLEFMKDGTIKQILRSPLGECPEIIYGELSGNNKLAMKSKATTDLYGRIYALLGSLSGLGETAITKLKGADLSIAESVGILFLQV